MEQSEDIGKLAMALSKAQGELDGASKSADNPFFKSKYADLHECIQAAKGPLVRNELAVIQTTELSDTGIVIVTTLAHSSGQWIRGKIKMAPKKDDDQGRGSSITYGRRYAYAAIVGLAQKDDDGNDSSLRGEGEKTNEKKKDYAEWITEADQHATTVDALGGWYKAKKNEIAKLSPSTRDKVNTYVKSLKEALLEAPDTIPCPNGGDVTAEDCQEAKCSSTYEKCAKGAA